MFVSGHNQMLIMHQNMTVWAHTDHILRNVMFVGAVITQWAKVMTFHICLSLCNPQNVWTNHTFKSIFSFNKNYISRIPLDPFSGYINSSRFQIRSFMISGNCRFSERLNNFDKFGTFSWICSTPSNKAIYSANKFFRMSLQSSIDLFAKYFRHNVAFLLANFILSGSAKYLGFNGGGVNTIRFLSRLSYRSAKYTRLSKRFPNILKSIVRITSSPYLSQYVTCTLNPLSVFITINHALISKMYFDQVVV